MSLDNNDGKINNKISGELKLNESMAIRKPSKSSNRRSSKNKKDSKKQEVEIFIEDSMIANGKLKDKLKKIDYNSKEKAVASNENDSSNENIVKNNIEKSVQKDSNVNAVYIQQSIVKYDIYLNDTVRGNILNSIKYINKDIDLKILGKVLYNKKKYYCEIECKLFDNSYYNKYKKEEISDIDVYAIRFDESLSEHRVGFECKSTVNNGVDEVLKIKGIQLYINFNKVGLLKKKISNNVRLIAQKLDVELYDEVELKKIVSMVVPEYNKKIESEKDFYLLCNSIEIQLKLKIKGVVSFTKGTYWTNSPEQNLHTIVRSLEHVRSIKELKEYEKVYIGLRLSLLCAISLLEIASIIVKSNFSDIENSAIDCFFGGATARWEKQRTYDLISQELGKEVSPYPYYIKDYINMISWIVLSLEDASRIPLLIEYYIKCYLLKMDYNILTKWYSDSTIKLSKDILRFTAKIMQDENIFEYIYKI